MNRQRKYPNRVFLNGKTCYLLLARFSPFSWAPDHTPSPRLGAVSQIDRPNRVIFDPWTSLQIVSCETVTWIIGFIHIPKNIAFLLLYLYRKFVQSKVKSFKAALVDHSPD